MVSSTPTWVHRQLQEPNRIVLCQGCLQLLTSKGFGWTYGISKKLRESLRYYFKRYWDLYNEIEGDCPQVAIASFGHGLIPDFPLYNDLIIEQPTSFYVLICRTKKHSRLEEDKIQRGCRPDDKALSSSTGKRKREGDHQKGKPSETSYKAVNTVFIEPIYKVMSKNKDKPIFK